jgi:hypothetical protein
MKILYIVAAIVMFPPLVKGGLSYMDWTFRWFAERNGY